jgi:hypothetical protein
MAGSQGLGLSQINFPFMLGTLFTSNRDLAKLIGFGAYFVAGWVFACVYAASAVLLLSDGLRYLCPMSPVDAILKQQRGLSPRSQRSWTDTPASSATKVSAMLHTSGWSGVTPASGQL